MSQIRFVGVPGAVEANVTKVATREGCEVHIVVSLGPGREGQKLANALTYALTGELPSGMEPVSF